MKTTFLEKNPKIIPLSIVLIAFILVVIPVRNTLTLVMEYFELKEIGSQRVMPKRPQAVSGVDEQLLVDVDHTKTILESLGKSCQTNKVTISKIDLPKETSQGTAAIETLPIELSGGFVPVLKSLREMNSALGTTKISSLRFDSEVTNKETNLFVNVVFQSVKPKMENEK